jgi:hypothetical protein
LLRRQGPGDDTFVDVCVSPCDIVIPRDGDYVIEGAEGDSGLRNSRPFHMPADALRAEIGVEPRSRGAFMTGLFVLLGGASLVVFAGLWATFKELQVADWGPSFDDTKSPPPPDQSGPIALAGVGAAIVLFAGVPLTAEYAHSLVTVNAPAAAPSRSDAQMAVPRAIPPERRAAPVALGIPLIRVAF